MSSRIPSSPVSSCRIGSNPEHIINMLKYRISPDIYLPHMACGGTLLELLDILGKDYNSEESMEESEREEAELVPVKIEYEEEEKESESGDSNDNDVDNVLVPVTIEYEEQELQVEEEKEPERGDSDDNDVRNVLTPVKIEHEEELVPVKIEYEEDKLQEEEMKEPENGDSDDNDIDNVQVPVKIEHDKDIDKLHPVETVATNKSVNEGVSEEWDPANDIDFYVQLFTSEGGLKEADVKQSGRQKSASSIRKKGKLCVEYQNKKGEVNEKEQEEGNDDEEKEGENDNEGEEEVEEEGEELQEEEKERDSVDSDDNDVHNLVLVPVNIEHEKNTENEIEKHKSKDEKLHPVETVETRKSLHEREIEDWDPQNDIDASVELFTPDGGSKEADGKQSGRQKSASSIRKKEKRFRITRRCEICSASTDDMSKHLERTHKLSKEERQKYLLAARGRIPIRRRAMIENPSTGRKQSKRADCPLCQGKNYTSLRNHFKTKHGLEANEAKEIRKRMKQGVELEEAYQRATDAADSEREEPEREEEHLKEHQESLEDAGMNKKQILTEEESDDEDNEDDEGDDKDEDWVPPRDWKNTRQQEYYGTNVEKENKKGEENERIEEDEEDNDQEEEEEVQKVEDDNEGEGEEEEEDDTEEGEKEPESVDNDVHKLLVPVNIGHEKRTENEKHESKDKKLNPVETVETSKSSDERETEELDPKHDIDASVELLTPDGGSKEADGKQSGRQKSASSIKKKVKRFRITRVCEICSASTDDMSKHLERTHKLSKEERQKYILAARGRVPIRRRAMIENPSSGRKESKREKCPLCEGKHYTSLQNHLETKHGLEANEAKEIRKRMKQGFVKRAPGAELDEAHQLGTDAADSETNDLLSRYRSLINLACDTTYGESSSTQHCRQLKNMCEMAFSKLLKEGLTPGINDDVVPSGECSKQKEREPSNSQMDAVKDVPGEGACSSVEKRPTKRKRKLLDSKEEDILRTEVQQVVNKPRRKGLHFREIIAEAYSNSQLKNVVVVQQYYDKARYMGLLK